MQAAFPMVLFGSIGLFVVLGVLSMLTRRNLHDQIGQDGLIIGEDTFGGGAPQPHLARQPGGLGRDDEGGELEFHDERELEIRQMLTARSECLVRQGHTPLDIDAELARLEQAPHGEAGEGAHDAALAEEVRQLVRARNERRARQGLETLDVEDEVQRTLAELDPP
jgi:hypothetical protein